jgi:hypothetical protein
MEHEERLEVSSRPSSLNYALPFELLGEIFSHTSEDPLDLRYAILVCRSWHNAVVHHANLWTNIVLGYTFLTRFQGARLRHGDAFVRSCISRSSPLPLRIGVFDAACLSLYGNNDGVLFDEYVSLVKHIFDSNSREPENLFQRCRSLRWICIRGPLSTDLAVRTFTSASFPALECMAIQNLSISARPKIGAPRLPRLREVTLIDHSEHTTPPFFHDDDFAKVERLAFIITTTWMGYDIDCIRRFRSIRVLMLKADGLYDNYMDLLGDPLKPAELSLLESLSLSGKVSYQILKTIRTPRLRRMEIEADSSRGWHSLVASKLVHLVGSLERLCVSFSEGIHETSWVEELERLIAKAPPLVSVSVSPWMLRCMVGKEWGSKVHVMDPK